MDKREADGKAAWIVEKYGRKAIWVKDGEVKKEVKITIREKIQEEVEKK